MYCPECGAKDQQAKTYCRTCGVFLPDLKERSRRREHTPKDQFRLSLTFNLLSSIASISMAIALLAVFLGKDDTHPVVYSAVSIFFVIGAWQIVSFINNLKLKRRFIRDDREKLVLEETRPTSELLPEADMSNVVPASVTERTTRDLVGAKSTQTKKQSD